MCVHVCACVFMCVCACECVCDLPLGKRDFCSVFDFHACDHYIFLLVGISLIPPPGAHFILSQWIKCINFIYLTIDGASYVLGYTGLESIPLSLLMQQHNL